MPKACPVCGSRKWRKDAVTGNAVCEDGHVFQDFRSENLVVESTNFALQKRSLKRAPRRNKRREAGNLNKDYYHGTDAEYLKVQAMQLLLRYQVQALRQLWSLPDAFEIIVRDLWAYQLAITPLPPVPSPATSRSTTPLFNAHARPVDDTEKTDEKDGDDKSDASASSQSSKGDEVDIDPEILAEISEGSSEDDLQQVDRGDQRTSEHIKDAKWRRRRRLRISDTIVTLVLALWVLRIPVMNVDIEALINDAKIPYLDFAHTTIVPQDMYKHMNREVALALSPARAPRPMSMFQSCRKLARVLIRQFGLILPEANIHPVAWQALSAVGSPPTTYVQVMRLLDLLKTNISFNEDMDTFHRKPSSRRPSVPQIDNVPAIEENNLLEYERTRRYDDVILPELAVIAAWVVVMKMAYGLDDDLRTVLAKDDPLIGLVEGKRWIEELRVRLKDGTLLGSRVNLRKQHFESMELDDLDRYLDQCDSVLLSRHDTSASTDTAPFPHIPLMNNQPPPLDDNVNRPPPLDDNVNQFPPLNDNDNDNINSWTTFHTSRSEADIVSLWTVPIDLRNKELPLMPGEKIKSYDASDITGTLPEKYEVVLRAAAQVVGVDPEDVARVVEKFETRIRNLMARRGDESRNRTRNQSPSRSASTSPTRSKSRSQSRRRSRSRSRSRTRGREVQDKIRTRLSVV
ncbi:hypothetical protein BCR39DRAFT_545473 [Naematelia encephala]|uniref:RRN7-type domain-containing protein n=1 Tax=Naematelia encephala TaxID=71784 RepID=A0A1Y2AR00_9TREE|nr:hypothetical protein BCR39DRAFT_545473 [Naematelia encephala]